MTMKRWAGLASAVVAVALGAWGVTTWVGGDAALDECIATAEETFLLDLPDGTSVEGWCEDRRAAEPDKFAEIFGG